MLSLMALASWLLGCPPSPGEQGSSRQEGQAAEEHAVREDGGAAASPEAYELRAEDWQLYQARFVRPEGRVVDTGNGEITHTEAQGYAMLLAVAYDDPETFDRLWSWTQENLGVREDNLFAWKWQEEPDAAGNHVPDPNNATDGDLLIAWALSKAGRRWERSELTEAARWIAADVRTKLVVESPHGPLLLPGEVGFEREDGPVVNLSYWCFPALDAMQGVDPDPVWEKLTASGLHLLRTARYGRWSLPPNWLAAGGEKPAPAEGFPPHFGYEGIRIPLYLIWSGRTDADLLEPFLDFWNYFEGARFLPVWTDLSNDAVDSHDAPGGIKSIVELSRAAAAGKPAELPDLERGDDYYSSSLLMIVKLAALELEP